MKTKALLLSLISSLSLTSFTQNLVPNPSFEETNYIPCDWCNGPDFENIMINWMQPSGSVDIYTMSSDIECWSHMPTNDYPNSYFILGTQSPRSDSNFVGIYTYMNAENYREYITAQLTETLFPNNAYPYLLRFYVSLADYMTCATNIGVSLSKTTLSPTSGYLMAYPPNFTSDQPITDTTNWIELAWCFFPEDTVNYITIGNFFNALNTDTVILSSGYQQAYYFIDDVSLNSVDVWATGDTTICLGDTATLYAHGNDTVAWALSSNATNFFSTDTVVQVTPTENTIYWLYGPRDTVPFRVYVDTTALFLGEDTTLCVGDTLVLSASYTGFSNLWSDNSTADSLVITQSGTYGLLISKNACIRSDDIKVNYSEAILDLGADTSIYTSQSLILDGGIGFESYQWSDFSNQSSLLVDGSTLSPDNYLYWLNVSNEYGCEATDSIWVSILLDTGIDETKADGIAIYPNPTQQKLHIALSDFNGFCAYSITSMDGRILMQGQSSVPKFDLNIHQKGIFFLKLEMDGQSYIKRLVVY